jgi:hypothetical protein
MNSGQLTEHAEATDADDERPEPSFDGGETVVPNDEPTLTTDTLFELLKNRRRRDTVEFLEANGGESTLSDLAEHIAAKENDLPVERISSKQRKRVYISLYQCHLPKMDRAGVIAFEKDRGTIELGAGATQLYPYLHATEDPETGTSLDTRAEQPTSGRVTAPSSALAGVGIAGLAGVAGVPGFDLLTPVAWVVVCALCLLGVAALPVVAE